MKKNSEKEISNFEKEKKGKETRKGEEQIPQAPAIEPPTTSSIEPPSSLVQQPKTMAHYWNLASIDQNTRTLAVHDLLADLKVFKAEHDLQESKEKIELFTTYQDVKDHCAPDVSYAFKRLIRGLSSSRDGARQGFSVALTEVLKLIPQLSVSMVVATIHEISEKNGKKTTQEIRELYFARIFGYNSIALSGMLSRKEPRGASLDDIKLITESLMAFSKDKEYLKQVCSFVFLSLLKGVQEHPTMANELSEGIAIAYLGQGISTPEHVWFILEGSKIFKNSPFWSTLMETSPDWKGHVLHPKNKLKLIDLLKNAIYYNQILHPVYKSLIEEMKNDETRLQIVEFWGLIDQVFFTSHSHDRKFMGFQMFTDIILPSLDNEEQVGLIFTPQFMRCLINSLSSKDTYLNKQARFTTNMLSEKAASSPHIALSLAMQLLGKHGHHKFDAITRTKTVENILSNLTAEGVLGYVKFAQSVFYNPALLLNSKEDFESVHSSREVLDNVRTWAIEQMYLLIRIPKISKDESWVVPCLDFLVVVGFFQVVKAPSQKEEGGALIQPVEGLPAAISASVREKVLASLGYLNGHHHSKSNDSKEAKNQVGLFATQSCAFYVASKIHEMIQDSQHYVLIPSLFESQERFDIVKSAFQFAGKIRKQMTTQNDAQKCKEMDAIALLLEHLCVILPSDPQESSDVVLELQDCYKMMFPKEKSPKDTQKKRKAQDEDEDETPLPVEVLTDILISFLSKPSALLRNLACDVFKVFASQSTKKVLDLFIEVLSVKASVQGAEELFEDQVLDDETAAVGDQESSSSSSEEDSDLDLETEEKENAMPVDEELRAKIQAALATDVEQDLEDLDDDAMEAFDSKLAEIFSQRKAMKNVKKESKETVLNFKLRVLDLVEIFLKSISKSPLFVSAIEPLVDLYLQTMSQEDEKVLNDKLRSLIVNKLCSPKEIPALESCEEAFKALERIHELCHKINDANGLFGNVSALLFKILLHSSNNKVPEVIPKKKKKSKKAEETTAGMTNIQRIVTIYQESFKKWMTIKNSKVRPTLFSDLATRSHNLSIELLPFMISLNRQSEKPKTFQLVKSFEIISSIVKRIPQPIDETYKEKIEKSISDFCACLIETLQVAHEFGDKGPYSFPRDRVKSLLKSLGVVIRKVKPLLDIEKDSLKASEMIKVLESVMEQEKFKCGPFTSFTNQIIQLLK